MAYEDFGTLLGRTLVKVDGGAGDEALTLHTSNETYRLYHEQDCGESVWIDDVAGDLADLIGTPILLAEETSETCPNSSESGTWTFYKLATTKGHVTVRFLGESNGYYSEGVSFERLTS